MINKKYRTIYSSVVPKGSIGTCVDVEVGVLIAFRLEFANGESLWFMKRDLEEAEE
ncbi:hypothetical protein [Enterococcus hermanniensis]|uniref:hypothetical protein n=1 Tax=Enterococcus hermanniensis TaxID=249189 RepID=UPI000AD05BCB|nr:hypothetical protein [Enterococcus hermanniensis]